MTLESEEAALVDHVPHDDHRVPGPGGQPVPGLVEGERGHGRLVAAESDLEASKIGKSYFFRLDSRHFEL